MFMEHFIVHNLWVSLIGSPHKKDNVYYIHEIVLPQVNSYDNHRTVATTIDSLVLLST